MTFVESLAARLKQPLPGAEAQLKMSPTSAKASARPLTRPLTRPLVGPPPRPLVIDAPADVRHAAALILLYEFHGEFHIPLTVRRDDLPHHPGQISLPGGGIDAGEMAEAASLREAEEEIGVDPATVRILGSLTPLYVFVSGFVVTPFVGVVEKRPAFRPEAREVEEILEVPLSQLTDPARRMWGNRTRERYLIRFPYFAVGSPPHHQVWGATAMILAEFVQVISEGS